MENAKSAVASGMLAMFYPGSECSLAPHSPVEVTWFADKLVACCWALST
ncbi:MAG: hypothetical protein QXU60_03040 [Sulfolobales archaeon]